ncbi:probable polygalacturonase At2g43860 [Zingiber officinale]|uniref:probable polygalacturonase At2g43860 n=1 Tax=Zingiber officinale TaxID=94328 RepID=UPI001C4CCEAC|nr:probable polygalacturonase At2g43860 [Zingiber officinale]
MSEESSSSWGEIDNEIDKGLISLFVIFLLAAEILADEPTYNVVNFGAKGDGNTDDTQVDGNLKRTNEIWKEKFNSWLLFIRINGLNIYGSGELDGQGTNWWSCKEKNQCPMEAANGLISLFVIFLLAAEILADEPTYNVVNFGAKGDGNTDDTQVDGNLKRTNEIWKENLNSWLLFIRINGLNIYGSGELDGQGTNWWSCKEKNQCSMEAANSLRLLSCTNVQISGLKLINSPMMHISVGKSTNVDIRGITISSPGDSPNTDGIHIQQSQHVMVTDSVIGTGDDCVSMSDGAVDVSVNNVACGPGHGISIGSLGIAGTVATASDIYVSNCNLSQTTNGVRIKTWPTTAVQVSDVKYLSVAGSSTSSVAIALNCSQTVPCTGITMDNVNLWSANQGQQVQSNCIDAKGSVKDKVSPAVPCLSQ